MGGEGAGLGPDETGFVSGVLGLKSREPIAKGGGGGGGPHTFFLTTGSLGCDGGGVAGVVLDIIIPGIGRTCTARPDCTEGDGDPGVGDPVDECCAKGDGRTPSRAAFLLRRRCILGDLISERSRPPGV